MDHSPATRSGHPHHILPPDNREAWQKALHVPERSQESALPQGFCFALEAQNVERVFHRLDNLRVNVGAAKLAGGAHTLAVLKHRAVPAQAKPCPAYERSGSAAETGTTHCAFHLQRRSASPGMYGLVCSRCCFLTSPVSAAGISGAIHVSCDDHVSA